jgi:hypothetical protein
MLATGRILGAIDVREVAFLNVECMGWHHAVLMQLQCCAPECGSLGRPSVCIKVWMDAKGTEILRSSPKKTSLQTLQVTCKFATNFFGQVKQEKWLSTVFLNHSFSLDQHSSNLSRTQIT